MRAVLIAAVSALALTATPAAHPYTPRERALYADGPSGRYLLDKGGPTSRTRSGHFRAVSIPNSFNARDHSERGERSWTQWYRERFTLPDNSAASAWRIRFESVNTHADVWLNGRKLGAHTGAHLPFELPAEGIRQGENELLAKVNGHARRDDIPPAGRERGWWKYGGILRRGAPRHAGQPDLGDA